MKHLYTLHAHKLLSMFVCTSSGLYRDFSEHAHHTYSDCFGQKQKKKKMEKKKNPKESKMATSGG